MTHFYPPSKGAAMSSDDLPFPIGTVVKLKSGGPDMTFESFKIQFFGDSIETAKCVYFHENEKIDVYFDPANLEIVDISKQSKNR